MAGDFREFVANAAWTRVATALYSPQKTAGSHLAPRSQIGGPEKCAPTRNPAAAATVRVFRRSEQKEGAASGLTRQPASERQTVAEDSLRAFFGHRGAARLQGSRPRDDFQPLTNGPSGELRGSGERRVGTRVTASGEKTRSQALLPRRSGLSPGRRASARTDPVVWDGR